MKIALCLMFPLAVVACWGGSRVNQEPLIEKIAVRSVNVVAISPRTIRMNLRIVVTASKNVTIQALRFENMNINGIPISVLPLDRPTEFRAHRETELDDVLVTLATTNVATMGVVPMILESKVNVAGTVRASVRLGFFARIFVGASSIDVDVPMNQQAEIHWPTAALPSPGELLETLLPFRIF